MPNLCAPFPSGLVLHQEPNTAPGRHRRSRARLGLSWSWQGSSWAGPLMTTPQKHPQSPRLFQIQHLCCAHTRRARRPSPQEAHSVFGRELQQSTQAAVAVVQPKGPHSISVFSPAESNSWCVGKSSAGQTDKSKFLLNTQGSQASKDGMLFV